MGRIIGQNNKAYYNRWIDQPRAKKAILNTPKKEGHAITSSIHKTKNNVIKATRC